MVTETTMSAMVKLANENGELHDICQLTAERVFVLHAGVCSAMVKLTQEIEESA